jgi:DNA-binding transcriptional MerR regulator/methylmalonyl-CoA mutase cobalamin-binding subunit
MDLSRTKITIKQLSQEIGIGVDTLRVWERRYGFPLPHRDGRGHRSYTKKHLEELRVVKKLQIFGQRPSAIFSLSPTERHVLLEELLNTQRPENKSLEHLVFGMSPQQIAVELAEQKKRLGLAEFVKQTVVPLLQLIDHGWSSGRLSIAREHLISDQLAALLKAELSAAACPVRPQVLFLTLPGERHKLGLLLAAVQFQQAGVQSLLLNEELPLSEIPGLAAELAVDGVALSFSSHYPSRQAKHDLRSLRKSLNPAITIIAGGQAVQQLPTMPKLLVCFDLQQIPRLVKRYFKKTKWVSAEREG